MVALMIKNVIVIKVPSVQKSMYKGVIYKVIVKQNDQIKFYFGFTANSWKKRFYHHKMVISNEKYANATALYKFYWSIKTDAYTLHIYWESVE